MVNSKYRLYEPIALVTFATGSTETITLTVYRRETWCVAGALLKHEMVQKNIEILLVSGRMFTGDPEATYIALPFLHCPFNASISEGAAGTI